MTELDTKPLAVFLREAAGISADVIGQGMMARAARHLLEQTGELNVRACVRRLKTDARLRQRLIEELVVPETWFFRDRRPFALLARLAKERQKPLRLLSLPCATGEEPYSMAIALLEAGLGTGEFTVDAVDISEAALAAAHRASYGANSFRGEGDDELRARWFETEQGRWRPLATVRSKVAFRRDNLFESETATRYDFVFCRNLLIYFDAETQAAAVRRLLGLLADDGVLFVGHAEAAVMLRQGLAALPEPGAFAFVRKPANDATPAVVNAPLVRKLAPVQAPAPAATTVRPVVVPPVIEKRAAPTLEMIRESANAGRLDEAAERVRAHLAEAGPSADAFYLAGVIEDGRGKVAEAEAAYRKALYLEPKHAEALTHLALLLEKRGEPEAAQVLWRRLRRANGQGGDA